MGIRFIRPVGAEPGWRIFDSFSEGRGPEWSVLRKMLPYTQRALRQLEAIAVPRASIGAQQPCRATRAIDSAKKGPLGSYWVRLTLLSLAIHLDALCSNVVWFLTVLCFFWL